MQHYIGTKIIKAQPAPADAGTEGYDIVYPDGFKSWSPADVFEAVYLPLGNLDGFADYQMRLIGERIDHGQGHIDGRHDEELQQPLTRLPGQRCLILQLHRRHPLSPVIRIDHSNRVVQLQALLGAHPGTRQ